MIAAVVMMGGRTGNIHAGWLFQTPRLVLQVQ